VKGFSDWRRESSGVDDEVLTGISGSRRDQPSEFMDSRKDADAIVRANRCAACGRWRAERRSL
jgi:hypothetical protein